MAKTANLYARIEPELKEQAEEILSSLGISASNAISIFYKQVILQRGLPFEVKLPQIDKPADMTAMTREQLHAELQRGYDDAVTGRSKPADRAFEDIRRDYGV